MLPVFLNQPGVRFLAACEVMKERRDWAKAQIDAYNGNTDCKVYRDYRELLARPDIDAVYIATGDRWHARLSIAAMRAGKDVYCEKPIALTIEEGEAVMRASELYQRIYQGGVQRRNVGNFVTAMKLAQSGRLGRVHTVHAGMARMGMSATNHYLPAEPLPSVDAGTCGSAPRPSGPTTASTCSSTPGTTTSTSMATSPSGAPTRSTSASSRSAAN